jgi:hypothetical protein
VLPGNYTGPLPTDVVKSSHDGLWPTRYVDVSPRFGFAARLPGARLAVLRGGYGIYYNRMSGDLAEQTVGQPPFSFKQSLQAVQNAGATLQNPYSPALPPNSAFPIFLPRVPGGTLSLAAISPHLVDPYVQQYNVNVQYEFTQNLLMELGYSGAKSTHIPGCYQFNQALLASPANPVNGETENTVENVVQRLPLQRSADEPDEAAFAWAAVPGKLYVVEEPGFAERLGWIVELRAWISYERSDGRAAVAWA